MTTIFCSLAALSVAILYYGWRGYHYLLLRRHRQLRDRVTFMLWVAANGAKQ